MNAIRTIFTKNTPFDPRAIRLFYLMLGGLCVVDAWQKSLSYWIAYAPDGIYPEEFASQYAVQRLVLPILSKLFSAEWPAIALGLYALTALMSAVFRKRRLWAIAAYILLAAIHLRSPDPLFGFDRFLIVMLFASLFMPDLTSKNLDRENLPSSKTAGYPFAVYLVQWTCIYVFTGLWKDGAAWRSDFTAIERSLWISSVARDSWLSHFLVSAPLLSKVLTAGVVLLEIVGPVLVVFGTAKLRNLIALSIIALHIGFYFCFDIGLFSFIGVIAAIPLISFPSTFETTTPNRPLEALVGSSWRHSLVQGVVIFFCVYIPVLNIISFPAFRASKFFHPALDQLNFIGNVMGIPQKWAMFAPEPSKVDEVYFIEGIDEKGLSSVEKDAMRSILRSYTMRDNPDDPLSLALSRLCLREGASTSETLFLKRRYRNFPDIEFSEESIFTLQCQKIRRK